MIKVSGIIKRINPTETRANGFKKRTFWLCDEEDKYPNTFQFELWKDDVEIIDHYQVGDEITCFIDLKGVVFTKDGKEFVMNTLKCWNIEKDGKIHNKN